MRYMHVLLLIGLLLLGLACGPAAPSEPASPNEPLAQSGDPPPEAEPDEKPPLEPTPTRFYPNPRPTQVDDPSEEPTEPPRPAVFDPEHPEGLAGCKSVVMFSDDLNPRYMGWCTEEIMLQVQETCSLLETADEQRRCGREIADQYESISIRFGLVACAGITDSVEQEDCITEDWRQLEAAFEEHRVAWGKIREGGDMDPAVLTARTATLACLEDAGHENPDQDLMFHWQHHHLSFDQYHEREDGLTEEQKDLRESLIAPTVKCADETGLFAEQDRAWAEELDRLQSDQPELVAGLIREGVQAAFERPGVTTFLLPQPLPHHADLN